MLYSDRKRFVFVHNPKTAGVSIRAALTPFDDSGGIFWGHEYRQDLERIVDKAHLSLVELRQYPEAAARLATHFVFGFVRNPYDRALSAYRYHCRIHGHPPTDFQGFLARLSPAAIRFDWQLVHFSPQHRLFYEGDKRRADFIGRFERVAADFLYIARRLGLAGELGRENASTDPPPTGAVHYLEQYSPEALLRVNDLYADDFHLFGYEMLAPGDLDPKRRIDTSLHSRDVQGRWLPAYDLFASRYEEISQRLSAAQAELDTALRERQELAQVLAETGSAADARVRDFEQRIGALEEEHAALRSAAQRAADLAGRLGEAERELRAVAAERASSDAELVYMKRSRSWQLTTPLRRIRALWS